MTTILDGQGSANRAVHTPTWPAGQCLGFVNSMFKKPTSDRPGFYTYALRAWQGTPAAYRHYTRDIPAGAVVYLSAGANGYGHICISVGNGTHVVSTDVPTGHVSVTTVEALEKAWGRKFVGWSNWLMGYQIGNLGPTLAQTAAAKAAAAKASASASAHPVLKVGSRGSAVVAVQKKLKVTADGIFGAKTLAAVKAFQKSHKLAVDGIVGTQTYKALGL